MYGAQNTYIPLRLIQGGVMPIIFASAFYNSHFYFLNTLVLNLFKVFLVNITGMMVIYIMVYFVY